MASFLLRKELASANANTADASKRFRILIMKRRQSSMFGQINCVRHATLIRLQASMKASLRIMKMRQRLTGDLYSANTASNM